MNEFDWDDLRLFLAVAKTGGLASASEQTGKSAPTLGRRILAIERKLGRELFRRHPRGYELTKDGHEVLAIAQNIEAQTVLLLENKTIPVVKISAGTWVTKVLLTHYDQLQGPKPIRLRFVSTEAKVDILRREAIIGVRNRRPNGMGLAARKIGTVKFAVFSLRENITTWVQVISNTPSAIWTKENAKGEITIEVTTPQNAVDLALTGCAKVVLPTFISKLYPQLIALTKPINELTHEQWLVTHHEERFQPEVRNLIDQTYMILRKNCADH